MCVLDKLSKISLLMPTHYDGEIFVYQAAH